MTKEKEPMPHEDAVPPLLSSTTSTPATAVLDRPATVHKEPQYDDEDFVCFVRLNWGTPHILPDKVDYVDKYTFTGGVCRNVRYAHAKAWLKHKTVHGFIFDNDVSMADIAKETGRNPESPENIAAAIHTMSPEKILAILGPEQARSLARQILGGQL